MDSEKTDNKPISNFKKHQKIISYILIFFLFVYLVFSVKALLSEIKTPLEEPPEESPKESAPIAEEKADNSVIKETFEIPVETEETEALPKALDIFEWDKITKNPKDDPDGHIWRSIWYVDYGPYGKYGNDYISLYLDNVKGTVYEVSISDTDDQYEKLDVGYIYLDFPLELKKEGWTELIETENGKISVLQADGVGSTISGFVKLDGDSFRALIYSYETHFTSWEGPGSPFECPCTKEVRVLMSRPIRISYLENLVEE